MSEDQWLRLVYFAGLLVLVLPALLLYRGRRGKLLRDIALWLAIACAAALAYLTFGPGAADGATGRPVPKPFHQGDRHMTRSAVLAPDPKLDLVLERVIDVPRELVWAAWTQPEHLKKWFTPAPWTVADCEIDLRPGGLFRTVMRSPEGEEFASAGCYLEVVPNERLVWTDALLPGYRPAEEPFFTAVLTLEPEGSGTRYRAMALHRDEAGRKKHEEMGFHDGWGKALDQLVALARTL